MQRDHEELTIEEKRRRLRGGMRTVPQPGVVRGHRGPSRRLRRLRERVEATEGRRETTREAETKGPRDATREHGTARERRRRSWLRSRA